MLARQTLTRTGSASGINAPSCISGCCCVVATLAQTHEQIRVLTSTLQSPAILGLGVSGHSLTPDFGIKRLNPRVVKLWFLLHNAFASIGVYPASFVIERYTGLSTNSKMWQTKVEDNCVAMLRCGYHTVNCGTTDVDEHLPHGSPV